MKRILAYGDSNTWGLIPGTSPFERYEDDVRWTGVLQNKLPDVRIIEEGLCGRTTVFDDKLRRGRNGRRSLPLILESKYPIDGAILMLGTNDCKAIYNASPQYIGRGIEQCLDELEKYVASDKILLISPIHLGEDVWREEKDPEFDRESIAKSKALKEVYQEIVSRRGLNFLAASDYVKPDSKDDEHLSAESHTILAREIYLKLQNTILK